MTDLALWEQWATHRNPDAFQQILLRHADMVFATCCRILRNASEAEEVTQECFERLAETKSGPTHHLAAWLHRVATNLSLNRLKSEARRREREAQFAVELASAEKPEWTDVYRHVDEALLELPEQFRTPVLAHYFERKSHETIAESLGVSRQTVTYRIGKGIESLRATLERRGVGLAVAAFAAGLAAQTAEAAPATLSVQLSKIALSGLPRVAGPVLPGLTTWKAFVSGSAAKYLATLAVLVIIAGMAAFFLGVPSDDTGSKPPQPPAEPAALATNTYTTAQAQPVPEAGVSPAPVTEPPAIHGVVYLPGGSPAAGATVEVRHALAQMPEPMRIMAEYNAVFAAPHIVASVTTDAGGAFTAGGLPAGEELLCVVREPNSALGGGMMKPLGRDESRAVEFRLLDATELSGKVVTETGALVPAARICLWGCYPEPKPSPFVREGGLHGELYGGIAETQADEEGRFTVKNIPRDWWVEGVSAEAPGFAPSFAWDEKSYSVIPDQSNVGTPILRLPLEAATITLQRALEVSGRVKIADGSPGQNARVRLYGELPNRPRVGMFQKYTTEERTYVEHTARYRQIVLADADGNYQVSAHPTMFQIDATLDNTVSDYHEFVPQSSRPMRNIDLVLQQTGSFSGTVFDVNTGKPAAVSLGAWWEGTSAPWRGQYTKSDGAGRFKFDNCRPGRWSLSERLGKIIMETSFGELAKGNVTFVIEPGQRLANCTIAVQPRDQLEVKMTGIVLDSGGRPVSKVQVTAMGRSAMTNEQGTFKVNLTAPGEVDVTAFDPSSGLSGFATAEVAIGQESSVEVTLTEQPASGSGSIYTKDGKLYDKLVKLRLWLESGEQKIIEAKNGHYDTGPIPPGQHMISVDSDGILATPSEHGGRVAAGQHVDGLDFVVELVEAMQGEVSGTVTYPDGRPAQGIWLQLAGRNIRKNGTTDDNGTFKFAPVGGHMEFRIGRSPDANGRGDSVWAYLDVTGESKDLKIVLEPLGKVVGEIDVDGDSTGPVWLSIQGQRGFHTDIYPVEGPLEASLQQDVYTLRFDTTSDGPKIEEVVIRDVVVESNKITDLGIIEVRLKAVKE